MKKVYRSLVFITFLTVLFLEISQADAAQGLKMGDVEVSPYGEITLQYDDNVYLEPNDEKDDFLVVITPGIKAEWLFEDNKLTLDYHVSFNSYMDQSSQDATEHFASGELELNWRDIGFLIYEDFKRVHDRPTTEETSRIKRDDNLAGIKAKYQRERLGIELGFEHFIRNYRAGATYEPFDRRENIYSILLTHRTFPHTDLLLEYDFGQIRYDESTNSDSDYHQFLVGAIGELTAKTTATIKAGYQARDYDTAADSDFNTGVLYADMTHKFSDSTALKMSFLRTAEESTYSVNNYFKIENVSTVLSHYFTRKLMGFVNGIYQINSYPRETTEGTETRKREDKYYSLGAGFKYFMREWLSFSLQAEHIVRDSNFGVYDYDQNLITFTARAEF